jgi:hypothetical protein
VPFFLGSLKTFSGFTLKGGRTASLLPGTSDVRHPRVPGDESGFSSEALLQYFEEEV